ncbi:MAG: stimulus-sensing domain-containing protein [Alphaproteobacteria bacterium]
MGGESNEAAAGPRAMVKHAAAPPRARRRLFGSPIRRRILAVNLIALLTLFGGVFYLDDYESRLVESELNALASQGEIVAVALGEAAVPEEETDHHIAFDAEQVRHIFKRVAASTRTRLRLFAVSGELLVDSRITRGSAPVQAESLPAPRFSMPLVDPLVRAYGWVVDWVPRRHDLPHYEEGITQRAEDYVEVTRALAGETVPALRGDGRRGMILSVGVPVQHYRKVVGAVMVSSSDVAIDGALRTVREDILKVFAFALGITVLLSTYLARTIARPLARLVDAAERVRFGLGRRHEVPEFRTTRRDEIGNLAGALRDMTDALWARMGAIERFAADVAHELKNPLSSLRSAVETAARVTDPEQQKRLMAIILDDVSRLDRLIGDISDASRLDAELSRAESGPVDVRQMLATLVGVYNETRAAGPRLAFGVEGRGEIVVAGIEDRLGQVFRNLIDNAVSFGPPGGTIRLGACVAGGEVEITVDDDGPGIPEANLESIFHRFYSERPAGEKFGTHSGLGLSISKQIVEAHGGTIVAQNRRSADGKIAGARFLVRLPL